MGHIVLSIVVQIVDARNAVIQQVTVYSHARKVGTLRIALWRAIKIVSIILVGLKMANVRKAVCQVGMVISVIRSV